MVWPLWPDDNFIDISGNKCKRFKICVDRIHTPIFRIKKTINAFMFSKCGSLS